MRGLSIIDDASRECLPIGIDDRTNSVVKCRGMLISGELNDTTPWMMKSVACTAHAERYWEGKV